MKGWQMYSQIQDMKVKGFSIRQVSRIIRISRNTIRKYWDMDPQTYAETYKAVNRMTVLSAYKMTIVKWLEAYPNMTAAQIRDWLDEKQYLDAAERTVRRYVAKLREQCGITRQMEPKRDYEAVEELPMGYQMQLDFGVKTVRNAYSSKYIKLYFVVFTLSYSRYKWGVFQERPFLSNDLVKALYSCFEYFGGMPSQLVYDQDTIIVVSENSGDIIHTQTFTAFLAESKLEVRVCRKSDPETKGLIEASVKYVKGNFMENRLYMGIEIWNQSFEDWLIRTGNGRLHGTTKRKPAEMFAEEQEHLLPLYGVAPAKIAEEMDRKIRPDNTILYKSNRYSVPYGTYGKVKTVFLAVNDGKLEIMNQIGEPMATHQICEDKGKLIKADNHRRHDRKENAKALLEKMVALLGEEFRGYLELIYEEKPRYIKEQLKLVKTACEEHGRECVISAMQYCQVMELFSANDLRDAAETMSGECQTQTQTQTRRLPIEDGRYHIPVQTRELSIYADVAAGNGVTQ